MNPCFWITAAPTDQTRQKTNVASNTVASRPRRSSVSKHSSMLQHCRTRFRFVCGMVRCSAFPIFSPSMPSSTKSTHFAMYLSNIARNVSASSASSRPLHHFHTYGS